MRCAWVKESNPLYVHYHDEEWGIPCHDDGQLFELLCLETYQAGLSWETVLKKRAAFRVAFHQYDVDKVAEMSAGHLDALLDNPNIIRHKAKLYATRANAQAFLAVCDTFGSFERYIWSFTNFTPIVNQVDEQHPVPSKTPLSESISKDMKKRGFKFVGPVCIYSFLQAAGLINDHDNQCDFK